MLSMIAAITNNRVLAKEGKLPWGKLPVDKEYYLDKIKGHTIIMGSTTYLSADHSREGNRVIVLSRKDLDVPDDVTVIHSPEEALEIEPLPNEKEMFITGGGSVYAAMLPFVDKIYLTRVDMESDGEVVFPELGEEWKLIDSKRVEADEENKYACTFEVYSKS